MTSPSETELPQPKLLRDKLDWLLLLAGLCLLPWVVIYCTDFWFRTNFRFFPILMVVPLGMVLWRGKLQGTAGQARWRFSLALWLVGGVLGVVASWLFSPWLGLSALTLVWMAWTLVRLAVIPWTQVTSWALPLVVLLAFPLSDATDPLFRFTAAATGGASSLLDLLSVPQMPSELSLELRSGRLDIFSLCRGWGNPYLLLTLTVVMCLLTRPSWLVSILTVASVPLWAWGGAVVLASLGSLLAEHFQVYLLLGYRLWLFQALFLVGELLAIWLFQRGLVKFFSPFIAHSAGVGGWHKFFNAVVLWPEPDPLRKRKSREATQVTVEAVAGSQSQLQWIALGGAALALLVAGGMGYYRLASGHTPADRQGWELVTQPHMPTSAIKRFVEQDALPDELQGMKLVGFEVLPTAGTSSANAWTARWTYAHQRSTVQLAIALPLRGFYPRERQWLVDGTTVLEDRQVLESSTRSNGRTVLLDELKVRDTLAGPSYLAYASWSPYGTLERSAEIDQTWSPRNLLAALKYQPTTVSLSLYVAGAVAETPEQREEYRRILLNAVDQF